MRRSDRRFCADTRFSKSFHMVYSVTAEEIYDCDGAARKCYGIEIISLPKGERATVKAITTSCNYAFRLAGTLSRCAVTPTTVHDVVYDWLCENAEFKI